MLLNSNGTSWTSQSYSLTMNCPNPVLLQHLQVLECFSLKLLWIHTIMDADGNSLSNGSVMVVTMTSGFLQVNCLIVKHLTCGIGMVEMGWRQTYHLLDVIILFSSFFCLILNYLFLHPPRWLCFSCWEGVRLILTQNTTVTQFRLPLLFMVVNS